MKLGTLVGAIAVSTIAALTIGCSSNEPTDTEQSAELTTLRIAAVQGGVMPVDFRAGVEEGIFEKHGLDVRIETLATGLDNISAAVQGSADIGYSDIFGGASARSNGFDVGLVTPNNGNNPFNYTLVSADSPVQSIADLEDKTIAIGAPPQFEVIASLILENAGVDPASVEFTLVKDQTTFGSLLKTGQVDAAIITSAANSEKWISEDGARALTDPSSEEQGIPLDVACAGWWATHEWYEENSETAQAFTDALVETQRWYATLSAQEQAAYFEEQAGADPVELDKEYPGLLEKLTVDGYNPFSGPVNEEQLSSWFEVGNKYADVPILPFDELLLPTARS